MSSPFKDWITSTRRIQISIRQSFHWDWFLILQCFFNFPSQNTATIFIGRKQVYFTSLCFHYALTCSAIAEYLNKDLPYKLSPNDVYVTSGCTQAIEILLSVLASPGANILLPRPGYPFYEARAAFSNLEVRHFNLIPDRGWEVDLDNVEALADENTVAMVVINPGNPCGNVFAYQHLSKASVLSLTFWYVIMFNNFLNLNLALLKFLDCRDCEEAGHNSNSRWSVWSLDLRKDSIRANGSIWAKCTCYNPGFYI